MICPSCKSENRGKAKFCRVCGHKFELLCPNCGSKLDSEANFCDECGHNFKRAKRNQISPEIKSDKPQSYIPQTLADKILATRSSIEGERKLVTVLFADVKGSTSIGENLDPEELRSIIEKSYEISLKEIHRFEGTVNQFLGDGFMALFGAPVAHEDHAIRAIHSALAIQNGMTVYSDELKKDRDIDFKMRIGINTGTVVVGNIGDDLKMDYTALGDTVNLASRMEQLAQPGCITIAEDTYKLAKDHFSFRSLGPLVIKGKKKPVTAYEVIEPRKEGRTRIEISKERGFTRFIGREREIEVLRDSFARSKGGSGQAVTIIGDAGIGKSRLLYEFRKLLKDQNILYLEGRCISYGKSISYLPVIDIIKKRFRVDKLDTEKTIRKKIEKGIRDIDPSLEAGVPFLYDILSIDSDAPLLKSLDLRDKRRRTIDAIKNIILADSKSRPLVVVVENLHWIDGASEEFISFLIDNLPGNRIMLILTSRPGYRPKWGEKSYHNQIAPSRLSNVEVEEMIGSILDAKNVARELSRLVTDKADGIPFYVEEVIKSFIEAGIVVEGEDGYDVSKEIAKIDVPNTIQDIIMARIDRLEESHKNTLQHASVIGRVFSYKLLKELIEIDDVLLDYLNDLKRLELVYEIGIFPELEYRFKHSLTQEVAYNSFLVKKRKELHGKIGEIIEDLYGDKLEENYELLAYHYGRSLRDEKAVDYFILAGDKSAGLYSHIEAKAYYDEALELLRKLPNNQENRIRIIDVILKLVGESIFYETAKTCLKLLGEAEKLAMELNDESTLAKIYYQMGITIYYSMERPDIGIEFANRSLEKAKNIGDEKLIASAYYGLACLKFKKGDFARAIDLFMESITLNQRVGNVQAVLHSLGLIGTAYSWMANLEKGEEYIRKSIKMAEEIGEVRRIASGYYYLGHNYVLHSNVKEGIENLQKSINLFKDSGDIFYMLLPSCFLGYGYTRLGDAKKGIELLEKNLLMLEEKKGFYWWGPLFHALLGESYLRAGYISEALAYATKAVKLATKQGTRFEEAHAYRTLGAVYTQKGSSYWRRGEMCLTKSIEIIKETGAETSLPYGYLALGLLYKNEGRIEAAEQYLEKAIPLFERLGDEESLTRVRIELNDLKDNQVIVT